MRGVALLCLGLLAAGLAAGDLRAESRPSCSHDDEPLGPALCTLFQDRLRARSPDVSVTERYRLRLELVHADAARLAGRLHWQRCDAPSACTRGGRTATIETTMLDAAMRPRAMADFIDTLIDLGFRDLAAAARPDPKADR